MNSGLWAGRALWPSLLKKWDEVEFTLMWSSSLFEKQPHLKSHWPLYFGKRGMRSGSWWNKKWKPRISGCWVSPGFESSLCLILTIRPKTSYFNHLLCGYFFVNCLSSAKKYRKKCAWHLILHLRFRIIAPFYIILVSLSHVYKALRFFGSSSPENKFTWSMTVLVPVSSFPQVPVLKRWSLERAMPCQEEYFLILYLWHSEAGICGQRGPRTTPPTTLPQASTRLTEKFSLLEPVPQCPPPA